MSLFRLKCPHCGEVIDIASNMPCPKCKQYAQGEYGYVQIYRMGSPIGIAVGYGIYINGEPYGHIGNKESLRVALPYGTYNFHFTCGMTRRCDDVSVTLSPEAPTAYVKARIKAGFWTNKIIGEVVKAEDMPSMD